MNRYATAIMAAEADDFLRGIDLIIESEVSEGENADINHLGIGIDVALASDKGTSNAVEKKTQKVLAMLNTGKMAEARYVDGAYQGKISNHPYTVLSVSTSHVENLFGSVLGSGSNEKEKNHILKYIVGYQIVRQLGAYYQVAASKGETHRELAYELATAYNFAQDAFAEVLEKVSTDAEIWDKVKNDPGMKEIEKFCRSLEEGLDK